MPSVDRGTTPRRRKKWTEDEDVRLLEALEHFGFGNWEDVARRIGTKSPEDAKERYITCYLQGVIGEATWKDVASESQVIDHMPVEVPKASSVEETNCRDHLSENELIQLGYMPNSDDYMCQYDHEAEKIVSNLTVNKDDDDLDVALKMALVCAYNRRIAERLRRKKIAREYNLPVKFFARPSEESDPKRREFVDRLRVFAQLMPAAEYEALVANLWGEQVARRRLDDLYRYRRYGVTRFDECEHFEQHYALRQLCSRRSDRLKRKNHGSFGYNSGRKRSEGADSIYIYG